MNTVEAENLGKQLVAALKKVFRDRLEAVVVSGSAASGSQITGFSDFEFAIYHHGPFSYKTAVNLQQVVGEMNAYPFAGLRPSFVNLDKSHQPLLVKGGYQIIYGMLPEGAVASKDDLRARGREYLEGLPETLMRDLKEWSVATGEDRPRQLRAAMDQLLPALRAMLVQHGHDPYTVWAAPLPKLIRLSGEQPPYLGARLEQIAANLPAAPNLETAVGNELFALLADIVRHYRRTETPAAEAESQPAAEVEGTDEPEQEAAEAEVAEEATGESVDVDAADKVDAPDTIDIRSGDSE